MKALCLSIVLLVSPYTLTDISSTRELLIVWNVGQGQWVTFSLPNLCVHFDSGGEFWPPKSRLNFFCAGKQNQHLLSHFDWDHLNFVRQLQKHFPDLCRLHSPIDRQRPEREKMYKKIPACSSPQPSITKIFPIKEIRNFHRPNDLSQVFAYKNVLLPGDSTRNAEKVWAHNKELEHIKTLIVGHHGSQTSTGKALLGNLPQIEQAIASCRRKRYGHPHREIVERLYKRKTPLLTTEAWNTIILEL